MLNFWKTCVSARNECVCAVDYLLIQNIFFTYYKYFTKLCWYYSGVSTSSDQCSHQRWTLPLFTPFLVGSFVDFCNWISRLMDRQIYHNGPCLEIEGSLNSNQTKRRGNNLIAVLSACERVTRLVKYCFHSCCLQTIPLIAGAGAKSKL